MKSLLPHCLVAVPLLAFAGQSWSQPLPDIRDVFQNELACAIVEPLLADMAVEPLYLQQGTQCLATVPVDQVGQAFFADDQCQIPVDFSPTDLRDHCSMLLDSSSLGEGQGATGTHWTLPPGTRMDLGARSLEGLNQPYLQRRVFRTIDTAGGRCNLEMRIYSKQPNLQNQRSLLALHGGSWSARGFGFLGLELTIPHFVDQGFVVYAPFYRLLGDSEGSAACHNATISEVVADAEAALEWVQNNAPVYGSETIPVVFGQSAGAHLATSLAVNQASEVAAAVLFYPPTDFADFALRVQGDFYDNEQGLGILERVIGASADAVNINASPVAENSFPTRIVEEGLDVAPIFMVHGMADDLVEPRQSVRLCEAISGSTLTATDQELPLPALLREIRECGADSTLHLIREGQHALDVCFADTFIATDLCPAGSEASRAEVASAIAASVSFATEQANTQIGPNQTQTDDSDSVADSGSGGGTALWLALVLVLRFSVRAGSRAIVSGSTH